MLVFGQKAQTVSHDEAMTEMEMETKATTMVCDRVEPNRTEPNWPMNDEKYDRKLFGNCVETSVFGNREVWRIPNGEREEEQGKGRGMEIKNRKQKGRRK